MQHNDRVPAPLYTEIRIACHLMLEAGYHEEATWLWMVVGSRGYCSSPAARLALHRAATVARGFSLSGVAKWIDRELLKSEGVRHHHR